VVQSTFANLFT